MTEAAAQGDRSENAEYIYGKKKLREIDRRMRYLRKRLEIAVIVDPAKQKGEKVFFGATVDLEDEGGTKSTLQIVGEGRDRRQGDEDQLAIADREGAPREERWRCDHGAAAGGEIEIEILSVRYG